MSWTMKTATTAGSALTALALIGCADAPPPAPEYRVAVAVFQHETCTFCPGGDVEAEDWQRRLEGDEVLDAGSYVRGFAQQARDYGDMELVGLRSPDGVFGGSSRPWNAKAAFDGFAALEREGRLRRLRRRHARGSPGRHAGRRRVSGAARGDGRKGRAAPGGRARPPDP